MSVTQRARFLDRSTPPHIATLIMMAGLSAIPMNMFLPSLPHMAEYFETDYAIIQLSLTLYLAINAITQIVIGPIADQYGRRPVVLTGFIVFICATIGTLFAPNVYVFLAFRMMQTSLVVGMVLSRAVVRDMYDQAHAASMIGYVTMGMSVVPMIAPTIGGQLDGIFGWKAIFLFMLVCAAIGFLIVYFDMGETNPDRQNSGLRDQIRDYPELLGSPRFWGYALTNMFSSGCFFAYLGGAPLIGKHIFGLDPATLGYYFGAPALGYFAGNFISGRFSAHFGIQRMICAGASLQAFGMLLLLILFSLSFQSVLVFFSFCIFIGLGNGLVIPNATSGMLSVRPKQAGSASGLGGGLMLGGGAFLSQVAGSAQSGANSAFPLIIILLISASFSILCMLGVLLREYNLNRS